MSQNKQRNQRTILELASQPGNNICADCKARLPRWASHNLGIFICVNCASIHRKIGTHITKVKSLTMDDWTKEQVETMMSIGNIKSNKIYNPNEIRNPPPPNLEESERDSEIEQYIRAKYEYRKFFDKSALVASKLGQSRSVSPGQPASLPRPSAHTTVAASTASPSSYRAPPPPKPPQMSPQMIPTAQPPQPSGGVWDDINSLKGNNSQNSSLPLQYQNSQNSSIPLQYQQSTYSQGSHSMQPPAVNGANANNNYFVGVQPSGLGLNLNPFQPNQVRTNPFSQQQSTPSFPPSNFSTTPTMSSQPFGEQSFSVSQSSASLPVTPAYYNSQPHNPQPQTSMQIQNPSGQNFISGSPSHLFPSTQSTGQSHLSPQSHTSIPQQQYTSHSPQSMQSLSNPNPQFTSHSPQLMQSLSNPNPQFTSHSPQSMQSLSNQNSQFTTSHSPQTMQSLSNQNSQFTSHSPQSMQSLSNQNSQFTSHSPQSMQSLSNPNPQFMYQNPGSAQSQQVGGHNIPGHNVSGHNVSSQSQFLGMTTMQMQIQQQQMQQQQMQQHQQQQIQQQHQPQLGQNYYSSTQPQIMSRQANSTYSQTSSVYPQGGFPPQTGGGLWGNTM